MDLNTYELINMPAKINPKRYGEILQIGLKYDVGSRLRKTLAWSLRTIRSAAEIRVIYKSKIADIESCKSKFVTFSNSEAETSPGGAPTKGLFA